MDFPITIAALFQNGLSSLGKGFLAGLLIGGVLPLFLYLVFALIFRRKKCRGIRIDDEHGTFFVTVVAVRDLVRGVIHHDEKAKLHSVHLDSKGALYILDIAVDAASDVNLVELRRDLTAHLLGEIRDKLGLDPPPQINLIIHRCPLVKNKGGARKDMENNEEETNP